MSERDVHQIMDDLPYGLYIIGSHLDGEVNGMMADWVMQVSFSPRLVAVAFENDAHTFANIRANRAFTVNLLPEDHGGMALAAHFAQPYEDEKIGGRLPRGAHHKLDGVQHTLTEHGCPVLDGAMAWLECEAEQFVPVGDHTLVIGRTVDGRLLREATPLTSTYTGWVYSG
jgi:3-hydroxy-9,10-secoandrosta-1,3,5(10)-triene-9,17-dione monooxygenase reductase component